MPQAHQLGRYHLLDRIAYGGMAEIFRAKTFDGKGNVHLVAVKRLLSHLITDDEFLQMLIDEAKISASLQHQNIARVYEFGHASGEYFLAMEYIDGKDVRALLERARQVARPIGIEHASWIAMECATALHAAHIQRDRAGAALRIVHRDVSPSNVLCSYRGDIKLCDFGIAKATLTRVQTKTGVIKGKVKYMSPEQALGRKLDHRSDLFSLGSVLYEMLTLQAPFQAPTEVELIFAVRDARKRSVRDLNPECPKPLEAIVDKLMTRSRSARYQSGEEAAADLGAFLENFHPGYRRSNFSRYMRKQFQVEIDRELRVLEGFTLEAGDHSQVGQNLIADALPEGAIFTKFTPVFPTASWAEDSRFPTGSVDRRDLHDRSTQIFDARHVRAGQPAHAETPRRSFGPRQPVDLHQLETQIKFIPGLHDQNTQLFDVGDVEPSRHTPRGRSEEPGNGNSATTAGKPSSRPRSLRTGKTPTPRLRGPLGEFHDEKTQHKGVILESFNAFPPLEDDTVDEGDVLMEESTGRGPVFDLDDEPYEELPEEATDKGSSSEFHAQSTVIFIDPPGGSRGRSAPPRAVTPRPVAKPLAPQPSRIAPLPRPPVAGPRPVARAARPIAAPTPRSPSRAAPPRTSSSRAATLKPTQSPPHDELEEQPSVPLSDDDLEPI